MRTPIFVLALLAGTVISGQSAALDASGTTVGVNPDAEASGAGGLRIIEIKGPIFMGDVITTDLKGQVQILFVDDTKFVVGANSKVTIDAFVFDANKTAQDVSISAVKGAFRFITGNSPKQNYSIKTPTMTIGVRGTAFDLAVRPGTGESMVVDPRGLDRRLRRHPSLHGGQFRQHDRWIAGRASDPSRPAWTGGSGWLYSSRLWSRRLALFRGFRGAGARQPRPRDTTTAIHDVTRRKPPTLGPTGPQPPSAPPPDGRPPRP